MTEETQARRWSSRKWGVVVLALLAVPSTIGWLSESSAKTGAQQRAAPPAPRFKAMASSQSADGVTDELMDQNFLSNLENHMVERQMVNTRRALEALGKSAPISRPTSSSVYILSGGQKFAVVRVQSQSVHAVQLMGIFGDEARTVVCISTEGQVPITYGPCADKIEETFGSRL